ncbi:hypothetical protein FACS1894186_2690 [Alphaproteobacteria bacterium]|nr:hypothetical protein FACS1894186_2690 [Alphaproteobacteria bacterium]
MKKQLAIWGWWQGKNLGDNWIKSCIQRIFPDAYFMETSEHNINDYPFVICGGGGLWFDSVITPWNYPIKTHFGALGLGAEFPHINTKAMELSRQADFFFIRDKYSLDCMGIDNLAASADITFSAPLEWLNEADINTDNLFFVWRDGSDFTSKPDDPQRKKFVEYGHYMDNKNVFDAIVKDKFQNIKSDDFQTTDDVIKQHIADSGFVISGRFHGVVMAVQRGIPVIAIDICPKIRALMIDAGLEKYCIKMDEVKKLPALIDDAKNNIANIRKLQKLYRDNAIKIINADIEIARDIVSKHLGNGLRGIHYGAYWMGQNDIINVMADDLSDLCDLTKIDLKIYSKKKDKRVKESIKTPNGHMNILDTKQIIHDIKKYRPDFILLNSGGIVLEDSGFDYCKRNTVAVLGTALSDPDVFPYNGKEFAHKFDLFYTNATYSLTNQYDKTKVNIKLLPFAASTKHHFPMSKVGKEYDIVVVGHARPDRIRVIEQLKEFKIGLFGDGWKNGQGPVHGIDHIRAINSGKIYLSFAATAAGYANVKVGLFEALACNTCVMVRHMDELGDYFRIGDEVICYKDETELIEKLRYYLTHYDDREKIRKASYQRFLREHTYTRRMANILSDVRRLKGRNEYMERAEKFLYECAFDGLAHSYDVIAKKWVKPYPEVTGYLLAYMCRNDYNAKKCLKIGQTLLKYQKNGGFPSFYNTNILYPFDTSQILIGLTELYKQTGDKRFYDAALQGGQFLIQSQMDNGAFIPTYNNATGEFVIDKTTYDLWTGPFSGLMCKLTEGYRALYEMTGNERYMNYIAKTISFYSSQPNIKHTHPMGYFLEGLWAGGEHDLVHEKIQRLILPRLNDNGYIAYAPDLPYAYVSGTIQLGILMHKCGFVDEAKKVRDYGRLVQSKHPSGGLFQYADENGNLDNHVHTEINSWGTKYFCELERSLQDV